MTKAFIAIPLSTLINPNHCFFVKLPIGMVNYSGSTIQAYPLPYTEKLRADNFASLVAQRRESPRGSGRKNCMSIILKPYKTFKVIAFSELKQGREAIHHNYVLLGKIASCLAKTLIVRLYDDESFYSNTA